MIPGFATFFDWASKHGYYVSPYTYVVFGEEKERRAMEAHFDESVLNREDKEFTDDEGE